MLALLSRRGASFASALGPNALPALMRLAAKGLVRCDSFAPVRALLEGKEPEAPKQRARVRAKLSAAGRWEIARPAQEGERAARMKAAFERWGILCRETARLEGIPWAEALARLRVQEYTGEGRRGYLAGSYTHLDVYKRQRRNIPSQAWLSGGTSGSSARPS